MSEEQLKSICDIISTAVEQSIANDVPEEIIGKLEELTTLLANSSHAVAMAQAIYANKVSALTKSDFYKNYSPTERAKIVAGDAYNELYYVKLTDRLNAALVHKIDALRSMLSYLKSELQNLQR